MQMSWEELTEYPNYEIYNEFPHLIRKRESNVICSESINNAGYIQICIGGETQLLHRVIAKQFIPNDNPDELTDINLYQLESYNGHEFNRYYFDMNTETLYLYTRNKYKIVKPTLNGKLWMVFLNTTSGKNITCSYNKLIREFRRLRSREEEEEEEIEN